MMDQQPQQRGCPGLSFIELAEEAGEPISPILREAFEKLDEIIAIADNDGYKAGFQSGTMEAEREAISE